MKHVRNEKLLPFYELTEEEQSVIEREFYRDNVEWLEANYPPMVWHQNPPVFFLHRQSTEQFHKRSRKCSTKRTLNSRGTR